MLLLRKYGVKVFATYMTGLPTETKTDALMTKAMLKAVNPDYKLLFYFTPIPGTKLHSYCESNDLLMDQDYTNGGCADRLLGLG